MDATKANVRSVALVSGEQCRQAHGHHARDQRGPMVSVGIEQESNPAYQKGWWFGPLEPPAFEKRESQP